MRYEILDGQGAVINVGVFDSDASAEELYPGRWRVVEPDPASVLDNEVWIISKLAFKNRFPRNKWKAAKAASAIDADLADFFESFDLAKHIDLQYAETVSSVSGLSAPEVPDAFRLTAEEVSAVLDTPMQPGEEA